MKNTILFTLLSIVCAYSAQASTCGKISSEAFTDMNLNLEVLHDSGVYEEGLSLHEYSQLDVEFNKDGSHYISIGAAGFSSASRVELACVKNQFEIQIDFDGITEVLIKDFVYENNVVVKAVAYNLEGTTFSKTAEFTTEGRQVVYGFLTMESKDEPGTVLSQYVNLGDYLEVNIDEYGEYSILLGSLEIQTHKGNDLDAQALLINDILYVEVPGLNVYIEIRITDLSDVEIEKAQVFVGQLDSVQPARKLGDFED